MSLKNKTKELLLHLFKKVTDTQYEYENNKYSGSNISKENFNKECLEQMEFIESSLLELTQKISNLNDKVSELDKHVANLITLQEELLYVFEQELAPIGQQDEMSSFLSFEPKDKKHGMN